MDSEFRLSFLLDNFMLVAKIQEEAKRAKKKSFTHVRVQLEAFF